MQYLYMHDGKRTQGPAQSEIRILFIIRLEIVVTLVQQVKRNYLTGNEFYLILLYFFFFFCVNELLSHFVVFIFVGQ